jgi:hypothetical protein
MNDTAASIPVFPVAPASAVTGFDDPALFINRELSWLDFNTRVLEAFEKALQVRREDLHSVVGSPSW